MRFNILKSKEREKSFILIFILSLLLLTAGSLFFFMSLVMRQSQVSQADLRSRIALTAAESGAQEAMTYLLISRADPGALEKAGAKERLQERWITNDNRYQHWGLPTNLDYIILSQPEPLDQGQAFYVAAIDSKSLEEAQIYALGGLYPLKGTNPLIRVIRVKTVTETGKDTNTLQGELIATKKFSFLGEVKVQGTNSSSADTSHLPGAVMISSAYPNQDSFKGTNRVEGYYLMACAHLPEGLQPPVEGTNDLSSPEAQVNTNQNILLVGSKDFLDQAKQGYETNRLVTRLNWKAFPPRLAPLEANSKEAPVVNIGKEKETNLVYQFDASGDYKMPAKALYPLVLKAGAQVNLLLPAGFVLSEVPVTLEDKAELVLFPLGDMTLGTKAFASVPKNWSRLTVWGGTNEAQKLIFQGNPNTLLCARIYAPSSHVILTNNMDLSGLLVGGEVTLAQGTHFLADSFVRDLPLPGLTNLPVSPALYHLRVKEWEEIELSTNTVVESKS